MKCPTCGSNNTEWANIIGDAARPKGSIYDCHDCGAQFDDRDLLPDDEPTCRACGFPTADGGVCPECWRGRI